jgi:hypothetical protein
MRTVRLSGGMPDEPDTGDWDALCSTPGPHQLFAALFADLASGLPDRSTDKAGETDTHRVHTIWFGDEALGVQVTETESIETTAFAMYCRWETFGLPGVKAVWRYALDRAGQLGYCAFRHRELVCDFDTSGDERRFCDIWRRVIGKAPEFETVG